MDNRVLVAYASKHGATAEIADKIGQVLYQKGLSVDVLPVKHVRSLISYKAVVLGNAVYIGLWRREAVTFLKANEKLLTRLPVWIFSCGPTGAGDPMELTEGWCYPKSQKSVVDRIQPQDITCFNGKAEMKELNFMERWILKNVSAPLGDFRDWIAIASWAEAIADNIKYENV